MISTYQFWDGGTYIGEDSDRGKSLELAADISVKECTARKKCKESRRIFGSRNAQRSTTQRTATGANGQMRSDKETGDHMYTEKTKDIAKTRYQGHQRGPNWSRADVREHRRQIGEI